MTATITSGQRKQLIRLFRDAFGNRQVSKDTAQRVIARGNIFQQGMVSLIEDLATLPPDDGIIRYPKGFQIRTVLEQTAKLLALDPFNHFDSSHVKELANRYLPDDAEGWAVIPKPSKIAENYYQALMIALRLIAEKRNLITTLKDKRFRDILQTDLTDKLTGKHLRFTETTAIAHDRLNEQPGDFWVVPFQFGMKYHCACVMEARDRFLDNEFGLGVYEVAILLLTHPDRLRGFPPFNIDCAGTMYSPDADLHFHSSPVFSMDNIYGDRDLVFDWRAINMGGYDQGSCSGFLLD